MISLHPDNEPGFTRRNIFFAIISFLGCFVLGVRAIQYGIYMLLERFEQIEQKRELFAYEYHMAYIIPMSVWLSIVGIVNPLKLLGISRKRMLKDKYIKPMLVCIGITVFLIPLLFNGEVKDLIDEAGYKECESVEIRVRFAYGVLYTFDGATCQAYRDNHCTKVGKFYPFCDYKKEKIKNSRALNPTK